MLALPRLCSLPQRRLTERRVPRDLRSRGARDLQRARGTLDRRQEQIGTEALEAEPCPGPVPFLVSFIIQAVLVRAFRAGEDAAPRDVAALRVSGVNRGQREHKGSFRGYLKNI